MGRGTDANGNFSTAMGYNTNANGVFSIAMGDSADAIGKCSFAMGLYTDAIGNYSTAMGYYSKAYGNYSTAMGSSDAIGKYSTAMGARTVARGEDSTAMGRYTQARGETSTAMGLSTVASGNYSTAIGRDIEAYGMSSIGVGLSFNPSRWTVSDPNVMSIMGGRVGIGTTSPSERLHVVGDIYCTGKLTSDGGNDPPYVLYNKETRESIKNRVAKEVPEDKQSGAVLFWNGATLQFEIYLPFKGEFRDILGNPLTENLENPEDNFNQKLEDLQAENEMLRQKSISLEARIAALEALIK
jgi:hypothetical protein